MDTYVNIIKGQLVNVEQSNKHFKGSRGEKGKKLGAIVLVKNLLMLEKIIQSLLTKLSSENGVDIEKCRNEI